MLRKRYVQEAYETAVGMDLTKNDDKSLAPVCPALALCFVSLRAKL